MNFKDIYIINSTDTRDGVVAGSPVYATKMKTDFDSAQQYLLEHLQYDIEAADLVEARINGEIVMRTGEKERHDQLASMALDQFRELYGNEAVCIAIECTTGTIYHELHTFSIQLD